MTDYKTVTTPLDPHVKLMKTPGNVDTSNMTDKPYQALIGSLMYAALGTCPDISYAVQTLSQYNSCPNKTHWTAAKHFLHYLKGTQDFAITYGRSSKDLNIKGYFRNF